MAKKKRKVRYTTGVSKSKKYTVTKKHGKSDKDFNYSTQDKAVKSALNSLKPGRTVMITENKVKKRITRKKK